MQRNVVDLNYFEPWSHSMISGVSYQLKIPLPKIPNLRHKSRFDPESQFNYSFGLEKKIINCEIDDDSAAHAINKTPPNFSSQLLEPTKDQSTVSNTPRSHENPAHKRVNSDRSILKDFDVNSQENDPFHAVELRTIDDLKELSSVLSNQTYMLSNKEITSYADCEESLPQKSSAKRSSWVLVEKTVSTPHLTTQHLEKSNRNSLETSLSNFIENSKAFRKKRKSNSILDMNGQLKANFDKLITTANDLGVSSARAEKLANFLVFRKPKAIEEIDPNYFITMLYSVNALCEDAKFAASNHHEDLAIHAVCQYPLDLNQARRYGQLLEEFSQFGFSFDQINHCVQRVGGILESTLIRQELQKVDSSVSNAP